MVLFPVSSAQKISIFSQILSNPWSLLWSSNHCPGFFWSLLSIMIFTTFCICKWLCSYVWFFSTCKSFLQKFFLQKSFYTKTFSLWTMKLLKKSCLNKSSTQCVYEQQSCVAFLCISTFPLGECFSLYVTAAVSELAGGDFLQWWSFLQIFWHRHCLL